MKQVTLTNGQYALVDDEDYERVVAAGKWYCLRNPYTYYAIHFVNGRTEKLANFILHIPPGTEVDHIDHNGWNDSKSNLRVASRSLNAHNTRKQRGTSSKYRGVDWHKQGNKWRATLRTNGRTIHLGLYVDESDAARAYDVKAKEVYGNDANLNFPEDNDA